MGKTLYNNSYTISHIGTYRISIFNGGKIVPIYVWNIRRSNVKT